MRLSFYFAIMLTTACSADLLSPEALSSKIAQASTSELCGAYFQPQTTSRGKLIIEAELAERGVNQCALGNYGQFSVSTAGKTIYSRSDAPSVDTYDCSDFPTGAAAQKFFLASGGPVSDPHNLDGDGDGLACEWGTQIRKISTYHRPTPVVRRTYSKCYTGPRGGTYTITASGNKNYDGCYPKRPRLPYPFPLAPISCMRAGI